MLCPAFLNCLAQKMKLWRQMSWRKHRSTVNLSQSHAAFWKDGVRENMVTEGILLSWLKKNMSEDKTSYLMLQVVSCNAHCTHTWRPYQIVSLIICWPSYNYHPPSATATCRLWTCCSFNSQWIWSRQKKTHRLPRSPNLINYPTTQHIFCL